MPNDLVPAAQGSIRLARMGVHGDGEAHCRWRANLGKRELVAECWVGRQEQEWRVARRRRRRRRRRLLLRLLLRRLLRRLLLLRCCAALLLRLRLRLRL